MTPLEIIASCVAITVGVITIITAIFRPLITRARIAMDTWDDFMEDWKGKEADSGHDATPGVMERLNNLDGEFKKNSGSTLKDAVSRIEAKLDAVDQRLDKGNEKMENIEARLAEGDERMTRIEQSLDKDN